MAKVNKWVGPFTTIPNALAFDKNLSWKAKGIFLYMQAKPSDWDFDSLRMATESTDGKDSTREGIKELVACKYLIRKKLQSGRMEYMLVEPETEEKPMAEKPTEGKTHRGKSRPIINKDNYKQIKSNTNIQIGADAPFVFEEYLGGMLESEDKKMNIIAFFFKAKGLSFNTHEKTSAAIKRHLRAAKELLPFDKAEIGAAIRKLNYEFPKFTLETVFKNLTNNT